MGKKKFASLLASAALVVAVGTAPAFAAASQTAGQVCSISSCTIAESHMHNGVCYAAHWDNDGHTYHGNCSVAGCSKTGSHETHNGGGHNGSGHGGGHNGGGSGRHGGHH